MHKCHHRTDAHGAEGHQRRAPAEFGGSGKKGFLKEMTSELDPEGRVRGKSEERSRQRTPL